MKYFDDIVFSLIKIISNMQTIAWFLSYNDAAAKDQNCKTIHHASPSIKCTAVACSIVTRVTSLFVAGVIIELTSGQS